MLSYQDHSQDTIYRLRVLLYRYKLSAVPQKSVLKSTELHPCADALRFNGPAPELINSRLAMVGFLYAASNEAQTGQLVLQQLQDSPLFPTVLSLIIIWASLIPITKGAKRESFGEIFTVYTPV